MIHLTAVFHVEEGIEHALGLAIAIIKKTMIITDMMITTTMMIITTISARDRQPGLKPATHKHVQVIHISIFRNSTHKIKSKKLIIFFLIFIYPNFVLKVLLIFQRRVQDVLLSERIFFHFHVFIQVMNNPVLS